MRATVMSDGRTGLVVPMPALEPLVERPPPRAGTRWPQPDAGAHVTVLFPFASVELISRHDAGPRAGDRRAPSHVPRDVRPRRSASPTTCSTSRPEDARPFRDLTGRARRRPSRIPRPTAGVSPDVVPHLTVAQDPTRPSRPSRPRLDARAAGACDGRIRRAVGRGRRRAVDDRRDLPVGGAAGWPVAGTRTLPPSGAATSPESPLGHRYRGPGPEKCNQSAAATAITDDAPDHLGARECPPSPPLPDRLSSRPRKPKPRRQAPTVDHPGVMSPESPLGHRSRGPGPEKCNQVAAAPRSPTTHPTTEGHVARLMHVTAPRAAPRILAGFAGFSLAIRTGVRYSPNMHSGWGTTGNDGTGVDDPIRAVRTLGRHADRFARRGGDDRRRDRIRPDPGPQAHRPPPGRRRRADRQGPSAWRRHRGRPRLHRRVDPLEDRPDPHRRPPRPPAR